MTIIRAPRFSEKTPNSIRTLSIEELTTRLLATERIGGREIRDKEVGYVPHGQPIDLENIVNFRNQRNDYWIRSNQESLKPIRSFFCRRNVRQRILEPKIPEDATVISLWQIENYWQVLGDMISNEEGAFWDLHIYQYTAAVAGSDYQTGKIPGLVATTYQLMDWYRDFDEPHQTRLMWTLRIPDVDEPGSPTRLLDPMYFDSRDPITKESLNDLHDRLVYLATPGINGN